ncbi:hypothetical protein [Nonomuraea sp. NPDC049625]|uniref:hypothetical protein n=1 Tax=Nonomuraea sp. NPDC049625 TaxID=3155775 RepID=UPI00344A1912
MDEILAEAGIRTVLTAIRVPRMNAAMERWVQSRRRELLDRCLLWETNATYSTPCVSTNSSTTGTVLIKPWIKRVRNAPSRTRSRIRRESST